MTDRAGAPALARDELPIGVDAVADRMQVLELTEILRDVEAGLDEVATDLERGRTLPIEAAARVRLLQRRTRTSPDGTSYLGRAV